MPTPFSTIARLPTPADNVAIATRRWEAGTQFTLHDETVTLAHTVLEGHRFAYRPIAPGEKLLSWGLPFGTALRAIAPGEYVCNALMLEALRGRSIDFAIPAEPNFADHLERYMLDEGAFRPGVQVPLVAEPRTFLGYARDGGRGAGTRNHIVILGLTSQAAGYARRLAEILKFVSAGDGIVAIAHTEGSGRDPLNNREFLLRTLAGFVVHPNVGAVLMAGYEPEPLTPAQLFDFMRAHQYPLSDVLHAPLMLSGDLDSDLHNGERVIRGWLETINAMPRTAIPLTHLKVALQCGGSDAYSGISANPLIGAVAKEIIQQGGAANLAETLELVGAEAYVLQNVRDLVTARKFLEFIERFKALVTRHGASAEGNPSGGNRYRGLYNIVLKSLGAAQKRDPAVRLDYAIEYAERMLAPGFYFMDSPGNDLESIAGQVASGANMIFFTTGNGSITNFPFVPTIKFVTTTGRFNWLAQDMDFNAGAYLDGVAMGDLAQRAFERTLAVASGERSVGERAGHSQVSIWRNWRQTESNATPAEAAPMPPQPSGHSLPIHFGDAPMADMRFPMMRVGAGLATDALGLILPTSLCAGQIARMSAESLNRKSIGDGKVSRFVALVHTEGCGSTGPTSNALHTPTLLNYAQHPLVRGALLLEHGCEMTHNDYMRQQLLRRHLDASRFGWASVQMDGGIEKVLQKIEDWFTALLAALPVPEIQLCGLDSLRLGLLTDGVLPEALALAFAQVAQTVVRSGGCVVLSGHGDVHLWQALGLSESTSPTLAYGQQAVSRGLHLMDAPSAHWTETLTGLGATGVDIILAYPGEWPKVGHPLIPVLQMGTDVELDGEAERWAAQLLGRVADVAARTYVPRALAQWHVDFQMTRGVMGVSV
jgi:altronate dehydratase